MRRCIFQSFHFSESTSHFHSLRILLSKNFNTEQPEIFLMVEKGGYLGQSMPNLPRSLCRSWSYSTYETQKRDWDSLRCDFYVSEQTGLKEMKKTGHGLPGWSSQSREEADMKPADKRISEGLQEKKYMGNRLYWPEPWVQKKLWWGHKCWTRGRVKKQVWGRTGRNQVGPSACSLETCRWRPASAAHMGLETQRLRPHTPSPGELSLTH